MAFIFFFPPHLILVSSVRSFSLLKLLFFSSTDIKVMKSLFAGVVLCLGFVVVGFLLWGFFLVLFSFSLPFCGFLLTLWKGGEMLHLQKEISLKDY